MTDKNIQQYLVGSLIASVVGAILLFVTEFAGWVEIQGGDAYYVAVDAQFAGAAPALIVILGVELILTAILSIWGMYSPSSLKTDHLKWGFIISLEVAIIAIIGSIAFSIILTATDAFNWWLGAGFYGMVAGGILTAIFFKLAEKDLSN